VYRNRRPLKLNQVVHLILLITLSCSFAAPAAPVPTSTAQAESEFTEPALSRAEGPPDPTSTSPPPTASPAPTPTAPEDDPAIPNTIITGDLLAPIIPISRGVLGQYIDTPQTVLFAQGSGPFNGARVGTHFRGVYTGLYAEYYDWQDPLGLNDPLRPPPAQSEISLQIGTLDFLRLTKIHEVPLMLNVNTRGVRQVFTYPLIPNNSYVMTNTQVLASLAADWVHYVNYTVQEFTKTSPPSAGSPNYLESHSAQILSDIIWQNRDGTNVRDELPNAGETLPTVTYWEIGNEPNFPLGGYKLIPSQFATRYVTITNAMIARDVLINGTRTIKIGPSFIANFPPTQNSVVDYLNALNAAGAVIDFVSYHPYDGLYGGWYQDAQGNYHSGLPDDADDYSAQDLGFIRGMISGTYQFHEAKAIIARATAPLGTELFATEWNPSSWEASFNQIWKGKSMAQALASMETVFTFTRLGFSGAHFLSNVAFQNNDTKQPLYTTFQFMENTLGDQLLTAYDGGAPGTTTHRAYITYQRDPASPLPGTIMLWALNWGTTAQTFDFTVNNLDTPYEVGQRCTLAAPSLLHGSLMDDGAPSNPPLSTPIPLQCIYNPTGLPQGFVWNNQLTMSVTVQPNSWVAFSFWPTDAGVKINPSLGEGIGQPGTLVTHTLRVTNTSTISDTMQVLITDNVWALDGPTVLPPLMPNQAVDFQIVVFIPAFAIEGAVDRIEVDVFSSAGVAHATLDTICQFPRQYIPIISSQSQTVTMRPPPRRAFR